MKEVIERLQANNYALEYAAFNIDSSKLEDLDENIIESTCPAETCLIEVRKNNELIKRLKI